MSGNLIMTDVNDLQLRQEVRLFEGPYGWATVSQLHPETDEVTVERPYIATSSFSYTGGVVATIGLERFKIHREVLAVPLDPTRVAV